jgi:hypothetical protein
VGRGAVTRRLRGVMAAAGVVLLATAPAHARAQANPSGRWLTLETAHFHVHVRADQRAEGLRAAAIAEAAFARLARELRPPSSVIELVVADNSDATDGYAGIVPWPSVLIFDASPVSGVALFNYDSWLNLVLTHELAHVFHLDLARGWWRVPRAVFGRIVFPNALTPDWVLEGLAVYYESRLTAGGRLRGSYFPAVVAAQRAEAGPLPADAAIGIGPRWPDGYRPYAFGGEFFGWLAATAGDSAVPRFIRETARRPIPYLGLNGALRPAAGTTLLAAWRAWQRARAAVGPDAAAPAGAGGATLVRGLRYASAPRLSRDGRTLLFVMNDGRDEESVATLARGTGRVRRLARFNGIGGVAWDGGNAVVSELDLTDPYTLRSDLWVVDAGGGERRLTRGARLQDPDVGPGGEVVAMQLVVGGTRLVRADSSRLRALTASQPGVEWAQPRWSPDGSAIVALRVREGRRDLVLLDRSGAVLRQLTRDTVMNAWPAFSPDGRWLLWCSDRSGRSQIYAARVDTAAEHWWRVTDEPFGAYGAAPAADSIFYLAYHHDGFAIAAAPFDTARWVSVAAESGGPEVLAVDADGAPPVLAEHGYRPWPSLVPRYWLPVVEVGAGAGAAWLGARISGADVLGRHAYFAAVSLGTGVAAGSWRAGLAYAYSRLVPWRFDVAYTRDLALVDTVPGPTVATACCHVDETGTVGASWVHARWRWLVSTRAGAEHERNGPVRRAGAVLSAGAWHLAQPAMAISLQRGWGVSALLRRRWRTDTTLAYGEALGNASVYQPLPFGAFARPVVAATATVGELGGSERVVYGVGGLNTGPVAVAPGLELGGGAPTFPVRGYPVNAILGRTAASASAELRLPLALVGRGLGLLPLYLDRLSVAVFGDLGATWNPRGFAAGLPQRTVIGSGGIELVTDLGVSYGTPVRLRVGAAWPLTAGRPGTAYVALGPSF